MNYECLACKRYGPPELNMETLRFHHVIPYTGPHPSLPDFKMSCPANVVNGEWKHTCARCGDPCDTEAPFCSETCRLNNMVSTEPWRIPDA